MVRTYIGVRLALEPLPNLVKECKVGSLRSAITTTKITLVLLVNNVAITLKWYGPIHDILDVLFVHAPLTLRQHTSYAGITPVETILVETSRT